MATWTNYKLETHPYQPHIPQEATHLIIGTFPTKQENRPFRFYYSGFNNRFWEIISGVFNYSLKLQKGDSAVRERKEFLNTIKVGITDMHNICFRINNKSQDHNLYPVKLNNVLNLLSEFKTIETLVFTSRHKAFGAFGLFNSHLVQMGRQMIELNMDNDGLQYGDFVYGETDYELWVPYSPSPSSEKSNKLGLDGLTKMYRNCFS